MRSTNGWEVLFGVSSCVRLVSGHRGTGGPQGQTAPYIAVAEVPAGFKGLMDRAAQWVEIPHKEGA